MAGDPNNTTARWLIFHQTLAWFRQRYPGATDKQAYEVLQLELIKTVCGVSEGVPIDKFRYPWNDQMIDLVVLIRNNYLTFEDIRWQNVECNLDWLERDWPLPALEAEAAPVPATDAAQPRPRPVEPLPVPPAANPSQPPQAQRQPSPQAVASEESPSPDKQLNDPVVGIQASARALSAPEQPETPPPAPAAGTASKPIEPAATEEPASSPPSALVASTEEPRKERSDEIAAPMVSQESSESEWDPRTEWSVETVFRELGIRGWRQRDIIEAVANLPKSRRYRGKTIPEILDGITAADLNRAVMEEDKPIEDSCGRFLKAWKARRIRRRSAIG